MTLIDVPRPELLDLHDPARVRVEERTASTIGGRSARSSPGPVAVPVEAADDDVPWRSSYPRCADGHGTLTHLFFSDDEFDVARAKAICGKCGLAERCLAGALDRVEPYGVWGGELVIDGVVVAVKRGRGRPPKTPRPPLVVDEVPVPPHLVA
jgi:WhiB family transcriptional regulator, redox-sensing transcriptional regulator